MPSPQPIKRNHLIKLHWLEILACLNLHGQLEELSCQPGTSSCWIEISTQPIAHVRFKSVCNRFGCATSEKLLMLARGLPNIYYQQIKFNPEGIREYIKQKTRWKKTNPQ